MIKIQDVYIIHTQESGEDNMNDELRVLLVSINNIWRYSNTGIDQLAGYLRENGFHVEIKYYHNKETYKDIIDDLQDPYDFIGFSVHSANYDKCCQISTHLKKLLPDTIICWGGYFPTMYYKEILNEKRDVDYIVLGDGEKPTRELLSAIKEKREAFSNPSVVTYNDYMDKKPFCNDIISHMPAFDYYEKDLNKRNRRKVYCLQTKNNVCTGKCSFCTERKGAIKHKNIELIITEIRYIVEHFGINQFFFTDDNIMDPNNTLTKCFIWDLCVEIEKLDFKIAIECYIKANSFKDCQKDHELLELMSKVGFATMFIGIEAGNSKDLSLYNKFTTVEENKSIVKLLRQHNIVPIIGFINFNPYTTYDTLKENFEFLLSIESANLFQYAGTILSLQRYTTMYEYVKRDGLLNENYNYMNTMEYDFADKNVKKLIEFVLNELRPRILNLDMEVDTLFQTYAECERINPKVARFKDELISIKNEHLKKIKEYFGWLYLDNDIDKCKNEVNNFLNYFEQEQEHLMTIYWEFIKIIMETPPI